MAGIQNLMAMDSSLEIFDEGAALDAWNTKDGWRASIVDNGTPGSEKIIPGDSNGDGVVFNSDDLILVSQRGEYEDDIDNNSTFEDGDWNGDGEFTTTDIVFAFIYGAYQNGNAAVASQPVSDRLTWGRRRKKRPTPRLQGLYRLHRKRNQIRPHDLPLPQNWIAVRRSIASLPSQPRRPTNPTRTAKIWMARLLPRPDHSIGRNHPS